MPQGGQHLLIIDPQNDFCDLPEEACALIDGQRSVPALPVPGAHADMLRLAELIDRAGAAIDAISITLDSHHHFDIGHPAFWQDAGGEAVSAFTPVQAADVRAGRILPRRAERRERVLAYLDALEAAGRYTHMIWPQHCEIGSWGHGIHAALLASCQRWEASRLEAVNTIFKGSNPWTEHYSAVMAEVPDPADPASGLNQALIDQLLAATRVFIAGEAGSHCVKASTEHIVAAFAPAARGRIVLLTDCMSPVSGFEAAQRDFLAAMQAQGVGLLDASQAAASLLAGPR
ncbi:cysteine hydrolase [Uliginosibacterium paludis]|uniref:Cysteine hydrolase n=1 Tax=Uliginosibacterium paludis TaxID=1615952 RepID=A0ABV2CKW6_9RHOO